MEQGLLPEVSFHPSKAEGQQILELFQAAASRSCLGLRACILLAALLAASLGALALLRAQETAENGLPAADAAFSEAAQVDEVMAAALARFAILDPLGTYTGRFNRRHKLAGHLFSERYKALVVNGSGTGLHKQPHFKMVSGNSGRPDPSQTGIKCVSGRLRAQAGLDQRIIGILPNCFLLRSGALGALDWIRALFRARPRNSSTN